MAKEIMQAQNTNELSMFWDRGLAQKIKLAKDLATSDIIPAVFKNKWANVFIVLNMADRMNADPFAIMQNMYIVYGVPSFSAKFLIGCFNGCGRYTSIKYEFTGKENTDEWGCAAYTQEKATGEKITGPKVTIGMAKKEGWYGKTGSKWQTMPQVMMQYRAAAFLIRTTAPEITMGMNFADELEDMGEPKYAGSNFEDAQAEMNAEVAQELEAPKAVDFSSDAQMEVPQEVMQEAPAPAQQAKAEAPKATRPAWANR